MPPLSDDHRFAVVDIAMPGKHIIQNIGPTGSSGLALALVTADHLNRVAGGKLGIATHCKVGPWHGTDIAFGEKKVTVSGAGGHDRSHD